MNDITNAIDKMNGLIKTVQDGLDHLHRLEPILRNDLKVWPCETPHADPCRHCYAKAAPERLERIPRKVESTFDASPEKKENT